MGFYVALASAAVSAYQGYSANAEAKRANAASEAASKKDYEDRLRRASEGANILIEQYNAVREERPSTSWNDFVLGFVNSIDDPSLRRAYTEAKRTDFQVLTEFATVGTETNSENVLAAFDKFTGGRGQEILDTRVDLVLQDTAVDQFKRANELRSAVVNNAGSVKFDDKGNLIEGQRSDKQTFQIAQEVDQQARQQIPRLAGGHHQRQAHQPERGADKVQPPAGAVAVLGQVEGVEIRKALEGARVGAYRRCAGVHGLSPNLVVATV